MDYFSEHNLSESDDHKNEDVNEDFTSILQSQIQQQLENIIYNTKPPASKTALRNLEMTLITKEHISKKLDCAICQDPFEMEILVATLPCKHMFHKDCLQVWLKRNNSCPLCREELLTDDPEYEEKKLDKKDPDRKKDNLYSMYM